MTGPNEPGRPPGDGTPPPVWDGADTDPWLTARLAALVVMAQTEQAIRQAVWDALTGWLVEVSRAVLSTPRPDPHAVWTRSPAWATAVDNIVVPAVRAAIDDVFDATVGEGDYDRRPASVAHLAEVRNRLVGVPDSVFDLIASVIADGVNAGDPIPQLADQVAAILDATGTPRWHNRATVIARTEALGALNAGRYDAYAQIVADSGTPMELVWLATLDSRVRPTHRAADGQRTPFGRPFVVGGFPLTYPGDPTGPPQEVIQCRCTTLLVEPGETIDMSGRPSRTTA